MIQKAIGMTKLSLRPGTAANTSIILHVMRPTPFSVSNRLKWHRDWRRWWSEQGGAVASFGNWPKSL